MGPVGCPSDVECMTVELCCDSVTCMPAPVEICDARPFCDPGDVQVGGVGGAGGAECPADATCYEASICNITIICQDIPCDPDSEPYRNYVGLGDECLLVDFVCTGETSYFSNDCGCGCAQDPACPEFVDCEPGGELDPLCDDTETCPLTVRAQ